MSLHKRKKLYVDILDDTEESDRDHLWSDFKNRHLFALKQMQKCSPLACICIFAMLTVTLIFIASIGVAFWPPGVFGNLQEFSRSLLYMFEAHSSLALLPSSSKLAISTLAGISVLALTIRLVRYLEQSFFGAYEKISAKSLALKTFAVWILCATLLMSSQLMTSSPLTQFIYQAFPHYARPIAWFLDWGVAIFILHLVGLYAFYKLFSPRNFSVDDAWWGGLMMAIFGLAFKLLTNQITSYSIKLSATTEVGHFLLVAISFTLLGACAWYSHWGSLYGHHLKLQANEKMARKNEMLKRKKMHIALKECIADEAKTELSESEVTNKLPSDSDLPPDHRPLLKKTG